MNKEVFLEIYSLIVFDTEPGEAIFLDKTALDVMEDVLDSYLDKHNISVLEVPINDN